MNRPPTTAEPVDPSRVRTLPPHFAWVDRRLALSRHLAPELAVRLDTGGLALSVASSVASFPRSDQVRLADAVRRHALSTREAEAFLATYRGVTDAPSREMLLRDPRSARPREPDQGASPLDKTAAAWDARFEVVEQNIEILVRADFSSLPDTDRRVLEARRRRLAAQILLLFHSLRPHGSLPLPRRLPDAAGL